MIKKKVDDSFDIVCGEYEHLSGVVNPEPGTTRVAVSFIFNATANSFGEELPPILFDELDWETEDEVKRRLREQVDNYLAKQANP